MLSLIHISYQQHDYLDVSKGKIQVSFEDGSTQERSLTTDMVSGYDPTTVSYTHLDVYKRQLYERPAIV